MGRGFSGTERGDEEVHVPIVVEVRGGRCEGVEWACDSPVVGLVGEGAVVVVDEETVGIERSKVEDVVEAIVVKISGDPCTAHRCVELAPYERVDRTETRLGGLVAELERWLAGNSERAE